MNKKPTTLSLTYYGKTTTVKSDSLVLHPGEVMEMFKDIFIGSFGEDKWNELVEKEKSYIKNPTCLTTIDSLKEDLKKKKEAQEVRRLLNELYHFE